VLPLLVITEENQPHVSPCWRHATKPHRWVLLSLSWAASLVFFWIVPFAAIAAGRNRFIPREIGLSRWAIALLAYVLMLGGHAPVIGASPFPV